MYRADCKNWYKNMCLDIEGPVEQCYEWWESNVSVGTWTVQLKEELHNIGLALLWGDSNMDII